MADPPITPTPAEPQRRLAAVVFADIVGYTAIASEDEDRALALVHLFQEVARDTVDVAGGRVVKFLGDGVLAEFGSADAAARAALDMSRSFAGRSRAAGTPADLRVGVHLGEVTAAPDGDVYGDGVNVASRIHAAAAPGQVFATEDVWRQLRRRRGFRLDDAGRRELKGIAEPVRVYRLDLSREGPPTAVGGADVGAETPRSGIRAGLGRRRLGVKRTTDVDEANPLARWRGLKWAIAAGPAVVAVVAVLIVGQRYWPQSAPGGDDPLAHGVTDLAPTGAPRSVAVLPFVALSRGEDDGYFADGLTEELLNALAAVPDLLVTARTSSFHFKGRDVPVPEVAQTLGVTYVIEGTVRRSGERLRITAQLIRGADGFQLWSESYDRDLVDVFAVQLDIAQNVAAALDVVLDETARARMADAGIRDVEAFIEFQKGYALYDAAFDETSASSFDSVLVDANVHFQRAVDRAPDFWLAHLFHSDVHLHRLTDIVYGRRGHNPDAGNLALERQRATEDLAAASSHAPTPEQRAAADFARILISDDWSGLAGSVERVLASERCLPTWYMEVFIPFDQGGTVRSHAERNVACNPLDNDAWIVYSKSLLHGFPAKALEVLDEARRRLGNPGWSRSDAVLAHIGLKQFDAAENALRSPELSEAERIELEVALHAARGNAGAAGEAAAAWLDRYGPHDRLAVIFAAWVGDAESADAIAARIDERASGPFALLGVLLDCKCGAAFDLDATPNLKARLAEAGFAWPPAAPFEWPLKDW